MPDILPDVTLGEIYSLLGEKDVQIYQLQKRLRATPPPEPEPEKKAPRKL